MFHTRLKKLRTEKRLSQHQLGKLLNLSQQTIGHYESGRAKPDIDTLLKFADLFGVSVDYLIGRTDNRNLPQKEEKNLTGPVNAEEALEYIEQIIQKTKRNNK